MTEDKGNIEEVLRSNLKDRKVVAPDLVWDKVEEAITEKGNKKGAFLLWGSGLFALLLLGGAALWVPAFFGVEEEISAKPKNEYQRGNYLFEERVVEQKISGSEVEEIVFLNAVEIPENYSLNKASVLGGEVEEDNEKVSYSVNEDSKEGNDLSQVNDTQISHQNDLIEENEEIDDHHPVEMDVKSIEETPVSGDLKKTEMSLTDEDQNNDLNESDLSQDQPEIDQDSVESNSEKNEIADDRIISETFESDTTTNETELISSSDSLATMEDVASGDTIPSKKPMMETIEKGPAQLEWFVGLYGGYSSFDMTVFRNEFRSGVLSNRRFESGGFVVGVDAGYALTSRLTVGIDLNYNKKNTTFNYSVRTDDQGYLEHVIKGNPLPLSEINDEDESCNCHLIDDVTADYSITTVFAGLTAKFLFFQTEKFDFGVGLSVGTDLNTRLTLNRPTILDVQGQKDQFSVLNTGLQLQLKYNLSPNLNLALQPSYHLLFTQKEHPFYMENVREFIPSFRIGYRF